MSAVPHSTRVPAARRERPSRRELVAGLRGSPAYAALAAVLVALGLFWLWYLATSYFLADDLIYLGAAREFGIDVVGKVYFQHWAPASRFLFWVSQTTVPPSWLVVVVAEWVGLAVMLTSLTVALGRLFEARWMLVALLIPVGFNLEMLRVVEWPSAGYQIVPTLGTFSVCLLCLALYRERPRWWLWLIAGATMSLGLLFYIKPVLIPVYLLGFRLLCLGDVRSPREAMQRLRAELPFWVAIAQPVVVYLTYYLTTIYPESGPTPRNFDTGPGTVVHFYLEAWFRGFWPGWMGKQVIDETAGVEIAYSYVLGQLAFVGLVALTFWRRGRAALGPWLFFLAAFVVGMAIVVPRLRTFGPTIGQDDRYLSDLPVLLTCAVAAAWGRREQRRPLPPRLPRLAVGGAIAVVAIVFAATFLTSLRTERRVWTDREAKGYFQTLAADAERIAAAQRAPVTVIDGFTPGYVLAGETYSELSRVLGLWTGAARIEFGGTPYVVQDDGHLVRAGLPVIQQAPARGLRVEGGRPLRRGDAICNPQPAGQASVLLSLRQRALRPKGPLRVGITTDGPRATTIGVSIDQGKGFTGTDAQIVTPVGRSTTYIDISRRPYRGVRFDVPPGYRTCVTAASVTSVTPEPGPPPGA